MTQAAKEQIIYSWQLAEKILQVLDKKVQHYIGKSSDEFLSLLQKYQDSVIMVGESIEYFVEEEKRRDIISKLEQYCEEIYLLSQCMDNIQSYYKQSQKLSKEHQKILKLLMKLSTRKVALFLPYKFSMWDSLESIYYAVKEDSEWEAVVMPIPYAELDEQHQAKEWKYEGKEFHNIPIVLYNEYNISVQKPDVIYIHNPYDEYNRVTSVASDFYSSELKKYCKLLIYVPYFLIGRVLPDVHLSLPSYENMDYIILPSEESVEQMRRYVPEKKLLALGSPKIDRMLEMSDKKQIPEIWKNRIRGRKIVLYNVSLNAILQMGFKVILKMQYIFNYFKRQNELVLWWRPHPLMKSTLKAMRPDLLGAYEEMEKIFIEEEIGIYDTTPDSNKAVACTDAFLGDYSSLCTMYGIEGKPIFITFNDILEQPSKEDRRQLWAGYPSCERYILERRVWPIWDKEANTYFYDWHLKMFCKMSKNMEHITVVKHFEDEYCKVQAFHTKEPEKMEIWFFPKDEKEPVLIYRIADGKWEELDLFKNIPLYKYGAMTKYRNKWIFYPGSNTEFLFVDEKKGYVKKYRGYEKVLRPYCETLEENLFTGSIMHLDNCIYILANRINKLLEFNLDNKRWKYFDIGKEKVRYSAYWYDFHDFWFFAWDGSHIARWNKESQDIQIYSEMPMGFEAFNDSLPAQNVPAFIGGFYTEEELFIFPGSANIILKLNKKTGEIYPWNLALHYEEGQRKSCWYTHAINYMGCLWYDEKHILIQTSYDGSLLLIDLETGEVERKQCLMTEEDYEKYRIPMEEKAVRYEENSPYYFYENRLDCTLSDMMDYFASGADMQEERQRLASTEGIENADGSCGRKVHEYMKKVIEDKAGDM